MSYTREQIERVLHYAEDTQAMIDIIKEILAENDALREDAERWHAVTKEDEFCGFVVVYEDGRDCQLFEGDANAIIDAARKKG